MNQRQHRVLVLIDWFDPAFRAGGPIQSVANLVRQYPSNGTLFRVFTTHHDLDGTELSSVPADCWVAWGGQTEVWYASSATAKLATIKSIIATWQPQVVFVNGVFSPLFNFLPVWLLRPPLFVVSTRGMLHPKALAQKSFKKRIYLAIWRMLGIPKRVVFHATNDEERLYIQQCFGSSTTVRIAANYPRILPYVPTTRLKDDVLRLITVALVGPMKNHLLVLEQLKTVAVPVYWEIFGPIKDAGYMKACQLAIQQLPAHIKVVYRGELEPRQVGDALSKADAFILPSKSENFGHAIFEALTAGKPVITSLGTPWQDLAVHQAGQNVDVDKSPTKLIQAIQEMGELHGDEWQRWTESARRFALQSVDISQLDEAYQHLFSIPTPQD